MGRSGARCHSEAEWRSSSDRTRPPRWEREAGSAGRRAPDTPPAGRAEAQRRFSAGKSLLAEPLGGNALVIDLMTEEKVEIFVLHVFIEQRGAAREYPELRVALGTGKLHLHLRVRGIRVHHRDVAHVRAASVGEGELARLRAARIADVHGQRPAWPRERAGGEAI